MRNAILTLCLILVFCEGCRTFYPTVYKRAKITVKVSDESGKPLVGVPIETQTLDHLQRASEWGGYEPLYKGIEFKTDEQGIAIVKVPHTLNLVVCSVKNYPGYRNGYKSFSFTNSSLTHWLPSNPKINIVLQKSVP